MPGKTGKTFLTNLVQFFLKVHHKRILAVALPAIATGFLYVEQTAYSALKIPIPVYSVSLWNRDGISQLARQLMGTALFTFIWYEFGMTHRYNPQAVNQSLKHILRATPTFWEILVWFIVDFWQIPHKMERDLKVLMNVSKITPFGSIQTLGLPEYMHLESMRNDPNVNYATLGLRS